MAAMKYKYTINGSLEDLDPVSKAVYDGLCNGEDKKVLANKFNMPIATVVNIKKKFKVGQKKNNSVVVPIEISDNFVEAAEEVAATIPVPKVRKKRKVLTDDDVATILDMLKDGYKPAEIAELAGVSVSTVRNIKSKNNLVKPRKVKEEKVENTFESSLIRIGGSVRAGLVSNRHKMPVDNYIFENEIDEKTMFDYDKLENTCRDFIKENIVFDKNGNATQSLVVYLTGIQCVLSSLIKVASEMKVNLTLRHYNHETDSYITQMIWNQFTGNLPRSINEILVNSLNSYMYNTSIHQLIEEKVLFKVTKVFYTDGKIDHSDIVLVSNIQDAFEVIKNIVGKGSSFTIYVNKYALNGDRFYDTGSIVSKIYVK